jgi:peptide/nickel transport system substrate-binding protein
MRLAAGICALAAALALSACEDPAEPEAEITIARAAAPAELDPALVSDHDTLGLIWLVYTPLLTYRHTDGAAGMDLTAGLATDLPEMSDDGRTYKLTLRKDLAYSDGTPAMASDFKRAVDRGLSLDSPAAPYLREISDISTDDMTGEITITLDRPDVTFVYALAMPATAPVPPGTAASDLSDDPPAGIGPYELDSSSGRLALVRSDSFADLGIPDIPRGNLARIDIRVEPSAVQRTSEVLNNQIDSIQGLPAPALETQIAAQASDRYSQAPAASTTYALLDRHVAPFDDPLVREAVRDGVDSTGCSLIPAGLPGYDHDFDTGNCDHSVGRARAMVRRAGAEGATVNVRPGSSSSTGEYVRTLRAIGLSPRERRSGPVATEVIDHFAETPQPFDFFERVADEPVVATSLDALRREPTEGGWTSLERYVLAPPRAYLVPLSHERVTTLFSSRMDPESAYVHPIFGNDVSSWRLKEGS